MLCWPVGVQDLSKVHRTEPLQSYRGPNIIPILVSTETLDQG